MYRYKIQDASAVLSAKGLGARFARGRVTRNSHHRTPLVGVAKASIKRGKGRLAAVGCSEVRQQLANRENIEHPTSNAELLSRGGKK